MTSTSTSSAAGSSVSKIASMTNWWRKGKDGASNTFDLINDSQLVEYERVSTENDRLTEEYKRLYSFIERLDNEYNAAKRKDPIRRHNEMKSMVKRTVMYLKLPHLTNGGGSVSETKMSAIGVGAIGSLLVGTRDAVKRKEQAKKRTEQAKNMTNDDLNKEIKRFDDSIKTTRCRINFLTDSINKLEAQYADSKVLSPPKRYQRLKEIIKGLTKNPLIREKPI